jgi:hypothetical protein
MFSDRIKSVVFIILAAIFATAQAAQPAAYSAGKR